MKKAFIIIGIIICVILAIDGKMKSDLRTKATKKTIDSIIENTYK